MILVDTREKPKAIGKILKYFEVNGIEYDSSKLYVGDYIRYDNPKLVIDRKQNIAEGTVLPIMSASKENWNE